MFSLYLRLILFVYGISLAYEFLVCTDNPV